VKNFEKSNGLKNENESNEECNNENEDKITEKLNCGTEKVNIQQETNEYHTSQNEASSNSCMSSSSNPKNFTTIATIKTRGRLGNHLWSYLNLMFVEFTYGIEIIVEKNVKKSLTSVFKNFENIKTVDDVCGYNEFFIQYRDMIDSLIVREYEKKSGVTVKLVRGHETAAIYPPEVALEHGLINAETLADSKEFIEEFKVDYSKFPPTCHYKVGPYLFV